MLILSSDTCEGLADKVHAWPDWAGGVDKQITKRGHPYELRTSYPSSLP
jgi:hypothetical protein